ncbi:MAG: hypothetical protein ACK575_13625 [Cyanobacteriota bacterium]
MAMIVWQSLGHSEENQLNFQKKIYVDSISCLPWRPREHLLPHESVWLFCCISPVFVFAAAQEASAVTVVDNIGSLAFPSSINSRNLSSSNWVVKSFSTPATPGYSIDSLKLPLAIAAATSASRTLNIGLYDATDTGSPTVSTAPDAFRPTGSPLGSASYTANFSSEGNTSQNPLGGYTTLGFSELGSIASYALQPSTNYSLVFSTSASTLGWRVMNTAYSSFFDFIFLNSTGTTTGTSLAPISIVGVWQSPDLANLATNGLTLNVVPGPLPVLGLGVSYGFSRKLRARIKSVQ